MTSRTQVAAAAGAAAGPDAARDAVLGALRGLDDGTASLVVMFASPDLRDEAAGAEMRRHSGTQFDPAVVESFLRVVGTHPLS